MFGYVSTKNLYLVIMQPVKNIEWNGNYQIYSYGDDRTYAFAYKKTDDIYIDFFTGTVYHHYDYYDTKKGEYVVRWTKPLITEHKRIPISILKEQLNELNSNSLDILPKQKVKEMDNSK